ncbi:flagellar hook-length control protein FliK [Psychromonas sp. KJ10-10]|uniref:flagellar hook-length control protein FliK n=1 Tax=Psychromonas sp. KJ10-10 TaxID=3391823 RepID=UPI0039B46208
MSKPPESEEQEIYALSESDEQVSEQFINPILAQIQAAQNTDTKVTNNKTQALGISNVDKDGKKGDKASAQDVAKTLSKVNTTNIENVLAESTAESLATEKDMVNKANLSANEKIEGMLANFRAEASKPVFNQSTDSHSLNSLGIASASADKLLNQTQASITNPVLQSSSLQQPLELQSKQVTAMVGERIMMMLNQGKQEVTIRLDPAELGSMHIKMQVQQEQLHVAIQTQVGQSRDIIEQNLPRLREQLAQQGINLGEASVEQQSKQNQSNSQGSSHSAGSAQGSSNLGEGFVEEQSEFFPTQIPLPAQGIDYYA